jgi:hypothetical protein
LLFYLYFNIIKNTESCLLFIYKKIAFFAIYHQGLDGGCLSQGGEIDEAGRFDVKFMIVIYEIKIPAR